MTTSTGCKISGYCAKACHNTVFHLANGEMENIFYRNVTSNEATDYKSFNNYNQHNVLRKLTQSLGVKSEMR